MAAAAARASGSSATAPRTYDDIVKRRSPLADFAIGDFLGKGAFGAVYEATDRRTGVHVAIKFTLNRTKAATMVKLRSEAAVMDAVSLLGARIVC
jgi:serine/threonine protein kinase